MTWYYLPCGSCNKNGSFSKVNPNCSRCSGTGNDWDEGESGRERLRSIYGKEPKTGKPPSQNLAGEQVYSNTSAYDNYGSNSGFNHSSQHHSSSKKDFSKTIGILIAIALVFIYLFNQPKKETRTNNDGCPTTNQSKSNETICLKNIMAEPTR